MISVNQDALDGALELVGSGTFADVDLKHIQSIILERLELSPVNCVLIDLAEVVKITVSSAAIVGAASTMRSLGSTTGIALAIILRSRVGARLARSWIVENPTYTGSS